MKKNTCFTMCIPIDNHISIDNLQHGKYIVKNIFLRGQNRVVQEMASNCNDFTVQIGLNGCMKLSTATNDAICALLALKTVIVLTWNGSLSFDFTEHYITNDRSRYNMYRNLDLEFTFLECLFI